MPDSLRCSPPGSSGLGFSRQEYWSRLPFPFPGYFPDPGIEPVWLFCLLPCRQILYHKRHLGSLCMYIYHLFTHSSIGWASLIAQLLKSLPAMQETLVWFLGREELLGKDRLPTPIFLGFPCGSAGKESTCNAGDLGLILGLGRSPGRRERPPTLGF